MRPQRFFLTHESINNELSTVVIHDKQVVSQIRTVLRLGRGDEIIVLDGRGALYLCTLESIKAGAIEARIKQAGKAEGDPPVSVTVVLPLLKGGRFEWALQKLTELGVATVVPLVSRRSVVRSGEQRGTEAGEESGKSARWQSIVREAAEQCERATVPAVKEAVSFQTLMENYGRTAQAGETRLICAERYQAPLLREHLHSLKADRKDPANISVIVGPEGGFTADEIDLAVKCGVVPVSLGPRILRSETAAIFAQAQTISVLGDA